MLYRRYKPPPPLGDFVDDLWFYDDYAQPHLREGILPSATIELVINLRENEFRIYDPARPQRCRRFQGTMVSGAYGSIFVIDTLEDASVIGAHFKPGGAFPFLGSPAGELADLHVDLETLWGRSTAISLRERLCAAPTPEEKFSILERALLSHLFRPLQHHQAVNTALHAFTSSNGIWTVGALTHQIGISQRRFIQVFSDEVGITPKLFCRIQRFQLALSAVQGTGSVNWAGLAADCGYFDQSHLIRDFLEFSGLTPADYLAQQNHFRRREMYIKRNHLPLAV
ncbi:MAG TPA: helix-turn-helix domain-containing protein [Candidatus Binataceae bacterium]|nr:helix-turn-helix domain-containing protein [Candidatus Binataceae bacterium]